MRPSCFARICRALALWLLASLCLVNAGCLVVAAGAAAAGGVAGFAYYEGSEARDYPADFVPTWTAAQAALADLAMPIEWVQQETDSGAILARAADGTRVKLSLEGRAGPRTSVDVRVGVFGDHPLSERILDQIQTRLLSAGVILPAPAGTCPNAPATPPPETAPPPLAGALAK
jgi:hypothetical protein